jgi:aldehyde:ferredoxin oxidoreductase
LHEQGILPELICWGDAQRALELVEMISQRQGIGDLMAEGSIALGKQYGVEGLAVQVNGLDVPMHDPRAATGMALVYATSPIGASHNFSDHYMLEISGRAIDDLNMVAMDRFANTGKSAQIARHQDWRSLCAALVQCVLPNPSAKYTVAMIAAATGYDVTLENVLTYGERMSNLKRALNIKLGYNARASEKQPELLLRALTDGGTEGHVAELEPMLREYYAHRDWDWNTGKPSREKLLALGMPEIARDLWK